MLDRRLSPEDVLYGDEIETVFVVRPAVPQQPDGGDSSDIALLAPADRFDRCSTVIRAASLHLDKGHQVALPDNQIEIVPAELETVSLHRPAAGSEKCYGELFSTETEELALVFPFGGWDEAAGARHDPR